MHDHHHTIQDIRSAFQAERDRGLRARGGRGARAGRGRCDRSATARSGPSSTPPCAAMTDTHQFFPLLRKFGLERQQSLRLVEGHFAHPVDKAAVRDLLLAAAFDGTPIMVFVGSPGCIQIHTGPVRRVEPMERGGQAWLNVLDPGFSLHLREDLIETVWVVEKPTSDGTVTSVEAFDAGGELMAMFFGARKPGQPELAAWRGLVAGLREAAAAQALS